MMVIIQTKFTFAQRYETRSDRLTLTARDIYLMSQRVSQCMAPAKHTILLREEMHREPLHSTGDSFSRNYCPHFEHRY